MVSKTQARTYVKGQRSSVGIGSVEMQKVKETERKWRRYGTQQYTEQKDGSAAAKIQARIVILTAPLNQGCGLRFLFIFHCTLHGQAHNEFIDWIMLLKACF